MEPRLSRGSRPSGRSKSLKTEATQNKIIITTINHIISYQISSLKKGDHFLLKKKPVTELGAWASAQSEIGRDFG